MRYKRARAVKRHGLQIRASGSEGFSATEFTNELNDIYQQSVVEWNVRIDDVFKINQDDWDKDEDGKMNDGESTLLSNYSDEQLKLKRQYKSDRDMDKDAYYVFVMSDIPSKTSLSGYMPLKGQYAFIHSATSINAARLIAHELGHGAFRLWHTFSSESDYYMAEKSSDNLMDYNEGDELHKYQWSKIHNPDGGFYMFQDEDEGAALGDDICFTIDNLINNFDDWFSNNSDLALFEHVSESFTGYLSQIKESTNNIELEEYAGWSIRNAAYKESANSYLAEKIYKNILNDESSSLKTKGIYLGEYVIEGKTYNTAVFSYKDEVNIKKFHTKELCELTQSEKIKVAIKDGYTLITFFDDNKNPEMILQVNGDELKIAKTWLTHLGIFTEKTTEEEIKEEFDRIVEYWSSLSFFEKDTTIKVVISTTLIEENEKNTLSSFNIDDSQVTGYIIEREGGTNNEERTDGSKKRIPGEYYEVIEDACQTGRSNCANEFRLITTTEKSGTRSGILIHKGINYNSSTGCLITAGEDYTADEIEIDIAGELKTLKIYDTNGTSGITLNAINTYIEQKKQEAEEMDKTFKICITINR